MPTTLIDTDTALYHKRMNREIRDLFQNGICIYLCDGTRICAVRCHTGKLQVRDAFMGQWKFVPNVDTMHDSYGRKVCATRAKYSVKD